MSKVRFAVLASTDTEAVFEELRQHVLAGGVAVAPLLCPTYAALHQALDAGACAFAWTPPLVARSLVRSGDAAPIAAVERNGSTSYLSAIVTPAWSPVRHLLDLGGARMGWVSRLSAAGYVVPRSRLVALGVPLAFADEAFFHSHAALGRALEEDLVDAVATYGTLVGRTIRIPHLVDPRILAVAAPIPGELVVAAASADVGVVDAVQRALFAARVDRAGPLHRRLQVSGFAPVASGALGSLDRWLTADPRDTERCVRAPAADDPPPTLRAAG